MTFTLLISLHPSLGEFGMVPMLVSLVIAELTNMLSALSCLFFRMILRPNRMTFLS